MKAKKKIRKKKSNKSDNKKKKIKSKKEIIEYGTEIIDKNMMTEPNNNIIAKPFNLDNESIQNSIGNTKFYDFEQRNFYSSDKSYLGISGYRHNILQHILLPNDNNEEYEIKIGLSHRYREKAITVIYYKSSPKRKN